MKAAHFALAELEKRARLNRYRTDFFGFLEYYFPHRLDDKSPDFHREIADLVSDRTTPEWQGPFGQKRGMVVAAPRGHSKTTILTFGYTMWRLLYREDPFIILIGSAHTGSLENVLDIRTELETNERIINDFGDLKGDDLGFRWTQHDFVAVFRDKNSKKKPYTARILALSPNAKNMRGRKHLGKRPTLIVVDDMEDDKMVRNPDRVAEATDWINKAAIPALHPSKGFFIMVGTILAYDSVLAQFLDKNRFGDVYIQRLYRAYWAENGVRRYLWPERFTQQVLDAELRRLGPFAFNSEYLNDPKDPETQIFNPDWIRWYTGQDIERHGRFWYFRGRRLTVVQVIDPAIREKERSDYLSHITLGVTGEDDVLRRAIVLLWPHQERMDFPSQVHLVIDQYNAYLPRLVGIETQAYQLALKQEVLRREFIPVVEINHSGRSDKEGRITSMSPLIANGQLYLRAAEEGEAGDLDENALVRVHWAFRVIYDQMMRYPHSAHDDLLDALEMAIKLARRRSMAMDEEDLLLVPTQPTTLLEGDGYQPLPFIGAPPFLAPNPYATPF